MKTLHPVRSAVALSLFVAGCASAPKPTPPAALEHRAGRIGVVAFTNTRSIRLQIPDTKTDIAAERCSFEVITPRMVGIQAAPFLAAVGMVEYPPALVAAAGLTVVIPGSIMVIAPVA